MIPIFANDTLKHLVVVGTFRVGVWPCTGAIDAVEILVVLIFIVQRCLCLQLNVLILNATKQQKQNETLHKKIIELYSYKVQAALLAAKFVIATVAPKVSFGVEFDEFMTFVTVKAARQTNSCSLFVRAASLASVQSLPYVSLMNKSKGKRVNIYDLAA